MLERNERLKKMAHRILGKMLGKFVCSSITMAREVRVRGERRERGIKGAKLCLSRLVQEQGAQLVADADFHGGKVLEKGISAATSPQRISAENTLTNAKRGRGLP